MINLKYDGRKYEPSLSVSEEISEVPFSMEATEGARAKECLWFRSLTVSQFVYEMMMLGC